jgi:hypothetical protein
LGAEIKEDMSKIRTAARCGDRHRSSAEAGVQELKADGRPARVSKEIERGTCMQERGTCCRNVGRAGMVGHVYPGWTKMRDPG